MTPKVSIILPNYNHALYLPKRVESIVKQTFQDFEILILDDASTDNSWEVIEQFADPRISHKIKNDHNSGSTFKQWQKGFNLAQGQYIWIAESDDVAAPYFLESMIQLLESEPKAQIAFCASSWIDQNGKVIHEPDHEKDDQVWTGNSLIQNELLTGNLIYNASSAVFDKSNLQQVDFNQLAQYKYAGDWFFWIQLFKNAVVKRSGKRLNFFRRHHGNVSFKAEQNGLQFKEGMKIVSYIFSNEPVSFLKKRLTLAHWAKKFQLASIDQPAETLKTLPLEMRLYVQVFKYIFKS